jgi:hypothetical protein
MMETLSNDRGGARVPRSGTKNKPTAPKAKKAVPTKTKAQKAPRTSAAAVLKPTAFRRFEKWMKEPGEPTEAILRGAAMLRSHYPKGR